MVGRLFSGSQSGLRTAPGIEPSAERVGDSFDSALAETINARYKAEVIHRRGPLRSFEAVEFANPGMRRLASIDVSWNPLVTSRLPKLNNDISPCWSRAKWPPDLTKSVSGKPGTVQFSRNSVIVDKPTAEAMAAVEGAEPQD
jgi:hypothetical protein